LTVAGRIPHDPAIECQFASRCLDRGPSPDGEPPELADLVNRLGSEGVALDLEALQVLRQPHLEAEGFQHEVGPFQQGLSLPSVFGLDQRFQQVVEVAFGGEG